jgi:hypothetical protein
MPDKKDGSNPGAGAVLRSETKNCTLMDIARELQSFRNEMKSSNDELKKSQNEKFEMINYQLTEIKFVQAELAEESKETKSKLEGLIRAHNGLASGCSERDLQINCLTDSVATLTSDVNNLKQQHLSRNLIINGLPASACVQKQHILDLAKLLGVKLGLEEIVEVRAVKTKKAGFVKVIFNTKELRNQFLMMRKGKSINSDEIGIMLEPKCQIFMQEDLTYTNQTILFHARKLKDYGFSGAWSINGQIRVFELATKKTLFIKTVDHVNELIAKRNVKQ